jgi:hypothetical protein
VPAALLARADEVIEQAMTLLHLLRAVHGTTLNNSCSAVNPAES